jgi:ribosome-interacting GTPase 1
MPANLSPEYIRLEGLFRQAKTAEEKLPILREMLREIPKHKGTDKMQADLKRRISKLEDTIEQRKRSGGGRSDPYHVPKEGAGQVVLTGAPNTGKSSILAALTHAHPHIADYPFTTVQPQPGMIPFDDVQIQLVDAPPLVRESLIPGIINLFRNTDMLLLVVDLSSEDPLEQAEDILGILSEHLVDAVAATDEAVEAGQVARVRKPTIVAANKADCDGADDLTELLAEGLAPLRVVPISCTEKTGLAGLPEILFKGLGILRVYTKKPGYKFERTAPYILPTGATVIDAAREIHRDFAENLKSAKIWGSAKYDGQAVQRDHILADGDIVEFHL